MENKLIVSECFYSIQGEGVTMGIPSVFLRLGGCNLLCTWCDTIEVWKRGHATDFANVLPDEYVQRLKNGAHLVITGGEPLLHQAKIIKYLLWFFDTFKFMPIVEVETNGTIIPDIDLIVWVKQWNCSPKLKNSGEPYNKRANEAALACLNELQTCFKFVCKDEGDVLEVMQDFGQLNVDKFILMPCGDTKEMLNFTRPLIAELCVKLGIRYSDRLHVTIWDKKTGV